MQNTEKQSFIKFFLKIAIPVVAQQILANLLQICDTAMISTVGHQAISGVSVANKFFFIYSLMIFGLSNGVGLFIAQYYGANDQQEYNQIFRFGLVTCILTAIGFMIFLFRYPQITMTIFVKNQAIIRFGLEYLDVIRWSYLPFAIAMMCGVALKVKGETAIPLKAGGIAFVLNILLNYLLINGAWVFPKLEVTGAALATFLSRLVEMLILLRELNRKSSDLRLTVAYPFLAFDKVVNILKNTIPLICNELVWSLALSAIFLNYCYVSEYYIPALTIVDNISSLVYALFAGAATATGVIVGQDLGANKLAQARQDAKRMIKIGTGICIFSSFLVLALAPFVPRFFSLTGSLAAMTVRLLMIKSSVTWSQGYAETIYYILRAGGDTKGVLVIDGLFTCFGPLLISTLCTRLLSLDLVWVFSLTEGVYLLKIVIATYYFKKEKWVKSLTTN